tara:strand:+ start:9173 stop:9472 length:300 start_codon:yes stop_codon:yes gene_type:complete
VSGYVVTGGTVPNDLPQGTTHADVGHDTTPAFVVATGTDMDGTIESTPPPFTFITPIEEVEQEFGVQSLFVTDTSFIAYWDLLTNTEIWESQTKAWENM